MARTRKSHVADEEKAKTRRSRLEPAYSARVDGHRYVIYCTWKKEGEEYERCLILKFLAAYAAHHFVSKMIGNDEVTWDKWNDRDAMIVLSSGIRIRAANDQMKEITNYEPTDEEAEWRDDSVIKSVNQFKYGRREGDDHDGPRDHKNTRRKSVSREERGNNVQSGTDDRRGEKKVSKRSERPSIDTSGYVSANDIAKQLGVLGREVRGYLRAVMTKPEHGWSWPKAEADKIKKQVENGLKEMKKGKKK